MSNFDIIDLPDLGTPATTSDGVIVRDRSKPQGTRTAIVPFPGKSNEALSGTAEWIAVQNTVDSMSALLSADQEGHAVTTGFYSSGDGGGLLFYWDSSRSKTDHNGGTIVDPSTTIVPGAAGWWTTTSTSGTGCWVAVDDSETAIVMFGAKAETGYENYYPIQAAIDASEVVSGTVIHSVGTFEVGLTPSCPYNVDYIGYGYNSRMIPSASPSFTSNFIMQFNTTDAVHWDEAYPPVGAKLSHVHFDNTGTLTDVNYGIFVAERRDISDCTFSGFHKSIHYSNAYLDLKTMYRLNIRQSMSSSDYAIRINYLGDGLSIDSVHIGFHSSVTDADRKAVVFMQCLGGSITNSIMSGAVYIKESSGVTVQNSHFELGGTRPTITLDSCSGVKVDNCSIFVGEDPGIVIKRLSNAAAIGTNTITDCSFVHRVFVKSIFGETSGADIATEDQYTVIRNCTRRVLNEDVSDSMVTGIQVVSSADNVTPVSGFNERSFFLSKNSTIRDLTVSEYSHKIKGGTGVVGAILDTPIAQTFFPWDGSTGTVYYTAQAIYDVDRMLGATGSVERSIAVTNAGDGVRIGAQVDLPYGRESIIRIYAGSSTGSYDKYVDIPVIYSYYLYDNGNDISGFYWQSRTAGPVDTLNSFTPESLVVSHDNVTVYTDTPAAPTVGTWSQRDLIKDATPASATPTLEVCTASGTPGTWATGTGI